MTGEQLRKLTTVIEEATEEHAKREFANVDRLIEHKVQKAVNREFLRNEIRQLIREVVQDTVLVSVAVREAE
jgi:DNA-binding transcriptional regulator YhcF (GntR family)